MEQADFPALRRVDLNLLLVFDTLMATRSATVTARLLHKTQPGVSRDLARLRERFGDALLVNVKGRLQPTERALDLHAGVHEALATIDRSISRRTAFDPGRASGVVDIGTAGHSELLLAAPLLERVHRAAPAVTIRFRSVHGQFDPADLDEGRHDLAIGLFDEVPPRHGSEVLFTDRRVAVVGDGHPLATRRRLRLAELADVRWFAYSQMHGRPTQFDHALRGLPARMPFAAFLSGVGIGPYVLMANYFATTMPAFAARLHARHFPLVMLAMPPPLADIRFRMVWPRRLDAAPLHRWLREEIRAVVDTAIAGGAVAGPDTGR